VLFSKQNGLWAVAILLVVGLVAITTTGAWSKDLADSSQIRTYYIAADEVDWNYAPSGMDQVKGLPFDEAAKVFVKRSSDRIGATYRKAVYRAYSDENFSQLKPVPEAWRHLGMLGPVIRAEVGDTIQVVFKNNTRINASIHPHGVFYAKNAEGALYNDGTFGQAKSDDAVPPGKVYTYIWQVPDRAGPGPGDPSSILWMYHSHVDEPKDTNAGLIGPILITARGSAKADGTPKDVDREFVLLMTVADENKSWYLEHNVKAYTKLPLEAMDKGKTDKGKDEPEGQSGQGSAIASEEFVESNLMHSINGYVFGNLPMMTMHKGDRVRWYVLGMGTEVDLHTPHWHGQTGLMMGMRMDMLDLLPGDMKILDMVPDNPGTWLFHCHVNDHINAGMAARYSVLP